MTKVARSAKTSQTNLSIANQLNELKLERQAYQEEMFTVGLELSKQLHEINKDCKKVRLKIPRMNTPKNFRSDEHSHAQAGMDY